MPTLSDVRQPRAVAIVRGAIARGRLHHALLLTGPRGAGKRDLALAVASALNCDAAPGEGCGVCAVCERITNGIHPDVITLAREGAAQIIPIETVRQQVVAAVGLPPHEARERVFVIDEATALQPAAANALLKTLEEPPARTLFVLCTTAPEQLLPTIRSRCQRVRFAGGTALASDADPSKLERIAALGEELARDRHDPTLPVRIAEAKGETAPVLIAAAQALHARAHAAASAGDLDSARHAATRAHAVLSWHTAVAIHNANPQLAVEALLAQLATLPASAS